MYRGAFDDFLRLRAEQQKLRERLQKRTEMRRKHLQSYVDRFRYKAERRVRHNRDRKCWSDCQSVQSRRKRRYIQFAHAPMLTSADDHVDNVKAGYGDRRFLPVSDYALIQMIALLCSVVMVMASRHWPKLLKDPEPIRR